MTNPAIRLAGHDHLEVPQSDAIGFFGMSEKTIRKYGRYGKARIKRPGGRVNYDLVALNEAVPPEYRKGDVVQEFDQWQAERQGSELPEAGVESPVDAVTDVRKISEPMTEPPVSPVESAREPAGPTGRGEAMILREAFQTKSELARTYEARANELRGELEVERIEYRKGRRRLGRWLATAVVGVVAVGGLSIWATTWGHYWKQAASDRVIQVQQLATQLTTSNHTAAQLSQSVQSLSSNLEQLRDDLGDSQANTAGLQDRLDLSAAELLQIEAVKAEIEQQNNQLQGDYDGLETELTESDLELNRLRAEIASLQAQIEQAEPVENNQQNHLQ